MTWVENARPEIEAESQWPMIVAVCVVLTVAMASTVGLRLYVRIRMIKSVGIDDYVMLASMICAIIYNGLCIGQTKYGLGLPLADRPPANLNKYSEINFAGRPFYMAGILGFKVALCFAYLRITNRNSRGAYKRVIWACMTFAILTHIGGTLVLFFQCSPVKKSVRPRLAGKCLDNTITFYVLAAISIICDLIIFLLPIPLLLKVQINTRRKVALIAIFLLGLFTTLCSIMRMVQISVIYKTGNSTMLVLWGTIEMNVGIFLTSLPSLTPLFTYFSSKAKTSSYGLSSYGKGRSANNTENSAVSQQTSRNSIFTGPTAIKRSDSQEHIIPIREEKGTTITKTTEIQVERLDDGVDSLNRKGWS